MSLLRGKCKTVLQDLVLPFQASADVNWHHPLASAADLAARRLTATCRLGTIRAQPGFSDIGLLQALHQHLKAGLDTFKLVSFVTCDNARSQILLFCGALHKAQTELSTCGLTRMKSDMNLHPIASLHSFAAGLVSSSSAATYATPHAQSQNKICDAAGEARAAGPS